MSMGTGAEIPVEEAAVSSSRAALAFRLGWVLAEAMGRLRHGVRPPSPLPDDDPRSSDLYAPRLTVGEGTLERSREAFWFAARRLILFAEALGLTFDTEDEVARAIRRLPEDVYLWLSGVNATFYTPAELRELLNHWALDVWAQLSAQDDALARALTFGTSLADTYWSVVKPRKPPPAELHRPRAERIHELLNPPSPLPQKRKKRRGPPPPPRSDWRGLLSHYRLMVEYGRVQALEGQLPPYVGDVLQRHLRHWSIGQELYYTPRGELRRQAFLVRPSHRLGWLATWRRSRRSPELLPEDEIIIYDALEKQEQRWRGMVYGLREPTTYLWFWDEVLIRVLGWVLLAAVLLPLVFLIGFMLEIAALLMAHFVPALLVWATQTGAGFKEWWTVLVFVLGLLPPLAMLIRGGFQSTRELQKRIHYQLTAWRIARRTLVPWDRQLRKRSGASEKGGRL